MTRTLRWAIPGILLLIPAAFVIAQPPEGFRGPGGPGGPGGPRGFGPPGSSEDRKLVEKFDQDENGWLDQKERVPARAEAKSEGERRGGFGPPGGRRGRGGNRPAPQPGPKVSPSDVATNTKAGLYDANVVRTLFFEFENEDWEKELEDFHGTDVDVPATLTVDGKTYENVGMRFRGMSSYGMVPTGYKRSFNVSIDMADDDQRLYGYKTLNLLNCAGDASFMSTVLYSKIASDYIPVPKANHVQVVINGESWGVYANVQQYDKTFISEHFDPSKGTRWKVSGSPAGDGGLRYMGEELEPYKARYDMKSNDGNKAWKALVDLCRTLNETPLDQLEKELEPMLDIDEALKFLAIDVALVNSDGYWTRASDYYLFLDHEKRFHLIPHDMNEAFQGGRGGSRGPGGPPPGMGDRGPRDRGRGEGDRDERDRPRFDPRERGPDDGERAERGPRPEGEGPGGFFPGFFGPPPGAEGERGQGPGGPRRGPGGFGGPGGPGHGGADLDPLVSIDNPRMALRNKLLAIPSLRAKYLGYVREIAEKSLAPEKIDAIVQQHAKQIEAIVASDTRKLESTEAFLQTTSMDANAKADAASLRKFCEERRDYLLNYQDPQASKR
ncbi:CotH kinase family protein [Bremerella sp. T1]|uniref:CotH kinase family protein n=1 Tax=Bremerella sp. TYQ1 TaxID=3119568 RepID=UPI001CCF4C7B|nr:CotH kinase family protein [Bremerella volcania]UBM35390.1 CotH kinase family protein [Bremerella volcania]